MSTMGSEEPLLSAIEHATERMKARDFGRPYFRESDYDPLDFDSGNFVHLPIPSKEEIKDYNAKVCYVDGGNALVFDSPTMSIHYLRGYASVYNAECKRHTPNVQQPVEYTVLVSMDTDKDGLKLGGSLFRGRGDLDLEPYYQHTRMDVEEFVSALRQRLELALAARMTEELDRGDVVVMDGSLRFPDPLACGEMEELIESARKKGVVVAGVSKTSRLVTSTSMPLLIAVTIQHEMNFGELREPWYYHPVAVPKSERCYGDIYVCHLHPSSGYTFRMDVVPTTLNHLDMKDLFRIISYHSQDLSFLGYPYGLIDADRHARISDDEGESMRFVAESMFHRLGAGRTSKMYSSSVDAHEKLDNM